MIDRYCSKDIKKVWRDKTKYKTWLRVELAVLKAMEKTGEVPEGTTKTLSEKIHIDPNRIMEIEKTTRHDVVAFLTHIEEQTQDCRDLSRWIHFGLTSSDILDTSFALLLKRSLQIIRISMEELLDVLEYNALKYKHLPLIGRTHGQHAEPTTLGLVFAGWYSEMIRNLIRLNTALSNISVGKISGAVGTYGEISPVIESAALKILGLRPETCSTQIVPRDRHAEVFNMLAITASSIERQALQIRLWQQTGIGEVSEPFGQGQKGSSAMPHKRNPIMCENLCGLSRLVRGYALSAMENISLWNERDISHSSVERVIAPDATSLVDFMLGKFTSIVRNLQIFPDKIASNLKSSGGLVFSEAIMLALIKKGVSRQKAHEIVQRNAALSVEKSYFFMDLLLVDNEISDKLTEGEIRSYFDTRRYLQHVDTIFDRVFSRE